MIEWENLLDSVSYNLFSNSQKMEGKITIDFTLDLKHCFNVASKSSILVSYGNHSWYVEPMILKSVSKVLTAELERWSNALDEQIIIKIEEGLIRDPLSLERLLLLFHGGKFDLFIEDIPDWLIFSDRYEIPLLINLFNLENEWIGNWKSTEIIHHSMEYMLKQSHESYVILWNEADYLDKEELYLELLNKVTNDWSWHWNWNKRGDPMILLNDEKVYQYLSYGIIKDIIENSRNSSNDNHYVLFDYMYMIEALIAWSNDPSPLPYSSTIKRIKGNYFYGDKLSPTTRKEALEMLLNNELNPKFIAYKLEIEEIELEEIISIKGLPEYYLKNLMQVFQNL